MPAGRAARLALVGFLLGGCGGTGSPPGPPAPLSSTFDSSEKLTQAVLDALAASDRETLSAFALNEVEFRTVVWPELPASRPERGVPFDYAWGDLHQKSDAGLSRLLHRYGGQRFEVLDVDFTGETTDYRSFLVHRDSQVRVRDASGKESVVRLFGSILQRDGEFKLFSYVVD